MFDFVSIANYCLKLLGTLLPTIGVDQTFLTKADSALALVIGFIQGAGYFLPIDTFVTCLTAEFLFNTSILAFKFGKWLIQIIRG